MTSFARNILATVLVVTSTAAMAQNGTPDEQEACRPDVRRFCHNVPQNSGSEGFLQCLQAHREKISTRCRAVLESHGV